MEVAHGPGDNRSPRWLAWGLVGLVGVLAVVGLVLEHSISGEAVPSYVFEETDPGAVEELNARGHDPCPGIGELSIPDDLAPEIEGECVVYDDEAGIGYLMFLLSVLGAVILTTSRNRIGWYLIAIALALTFQGAGLTYAAKALVVDPGSLPGGYLVTFLAWPGWVVAAVFLMPRLILDFPTGSLPSPGWRWVIRATYLTTGSIIVIQWLDPFWINDVPSPLPITLPRDAPGTLFDLAITGWIVTVITSLVGLLYRFWKSTGEERQQLKWVAYAVVLALVVNTLATFLPSAGVEGTIQQIVSFVILPIATLFSIFKYRLYDIDRIINRTVVYGSVSLVVAAVFVAAVVLPQTLVADAGALDPILIVVVAGATLLVAAVFNPLRSRIQAAVDRRFNRTKYDAEQVVGAFHERLQHEVDLTTLMADVNKVVGATVAPDQIGVWSAGRRDQ